MEKQNKKIIVFETECAYDIPTNPKKFLQWWQQKFAEIPDEHMDTAVVDLRAEEDSLYENSPYLEVSIYYYRPETDEELAGRYEAERRKAEAQAAVERKTAGRTQAEVRTMTPNDAKKEMSRWAEPK